MSLIQDQRSLLLIENIYLKYKLLKMRKKSKRASPNVIYKDRFIFGEFHQLYPQLRTDKIMFRAYTRMTIDTFDYIAQHITPLCQKEYTNFQDPISVEERLLITIRYLATGIAFRQISMSFRVSKTSVSYIVIEVCQAIWTTLRDVHMRKPSITDFENTADAFYNKWNFPNCIGSIDGKHIRVKCPKNSGSVYYNYKQFFSIVLLAIVDANYRFMLIDIGAYGKDSDGGVLHNSKIYHRIEKGTLKVPNTKLLPNTTNMAPFVFIGDEAFPLREHLLRPFPKKQLGDEDKSYYNYRLSRARMTVECAFGIAASKFCILQKSIETKIENADHIVKAICILHNVIIDLEKNQVDLRTIETENEISSTNYLDSIRGSRFTNRTSQSVLEIRNTFVQYFKHNKI